MIRVRPAFALLLCCAVGPLAAAGVFDRPDDPAAAATAPDPAPDPARVRPAAKGPPIAPVSAANTVRDAGMLRPAFIFDPALARQPAVGRAAPEGLDQFATLVARGQGAGLAGVLYDNRDRGHATLPPALFPQLAWTAYSEEARAAGVDYGPNLRLLFPAPVIGNSSTAITGGPFRRSQPRKVLTSAGGAEALWRLYTSNHLYVYPEHKDHDPVRVPAGETAGLGDLFPANTPYMLISQGSSRTDIPFVTALAAMLGALRPETRALAEREGLIAPTLQMLLRQTLAGDRKTYLSGVAHPSVFTAESLDLARLVAAAQALAPGDLPALVQIAMVEESPFVPGPDDLAGVLGERLFDTPGAIARLWRATGYQRVYVVDAGASRDANGRALRFEWRLLRGREDQVRITPLGRDGTRARIEVDWHGRHEVPGSWGRMTTDRVDIGVFADNGATLSAPAFLSVMFPADEGRIYAAGPDGEIVIRRIVRGVRSREVYTDPLLFPRCDWTDDFSYAPGGQLTGWTRRIGKRTERYTADGRLVREVDAAGRPMVAEAVSYPVAAAGRRGLPRVTPTPNGSLFRYRYRGAGDRVGRAVAVPKADAP